MTTQPMHVRTTHKPVYAQAFRVPAATDIDGMNAFIAWLIEMKIPFISGKQTDGNGKDIDGTKWVDLSADGEREEVRLREGNTVVARRPVVAPFAVPPRTIVKTYTGYSKTDGFEEFEADYEFDPAALSLARG